MLKWLPCPLLRISLAFLPGIYVGLKFNYPVIIVELLWVVAFLVFLFILKTTNLSFRIWNPVISLLGLTLIFAAGILRAYWQPHTPNMLVGDAEYYQARVIKTSNDADKRCLVELEWIRVSNTTFRVNDRIQWFQGKNKIKKISPGDRLIVKEAPYAIRPPANPREFDYARYMSRKNIFWQHWIEERDVLKVLPERHFGMAKLLDKIRNELQLLITLNLTKGAPQEITRAMLLGDRSAVSENLLDSFADSGTMHVLAVSGLHLGIVYWLLLKLFGRLRHHKVSKWLFVLICLSVLWGFTLVTGMAPSTQRASIMCSMMLLGNSLSRNSTNSNSLGAAAICILYLDPYQLYSVGFQLSFVALGGILYLYPLIGTIWRPEHQLIKYFWELIKVSISAQVAVLPLAVYYFNQLPVYFLIANMFLIPLAFAIIISGILFFVFTMVPQVSMLTIGTLEFLTKTASRIVIEVSALPGSTIHPLELNVPGVLVSYLMIWLLVLFCKSRRKVYWSAFMVITTLVVCGKTVRALINNNHREIIVYQVPGHTAIDLVAGGKYSTIMDVQLPDDAATIAYKMENYRRYLGLKKPLDVITIGGNHPSLDSWEFYGKKILLIESSLPKTAGGNVNLKYDIVIMTNNSVADLGELPSGLESDLWIIDGSYKPWIAKQLETAALNGGLKVHNCWTYGAKIINL